MAARIEFDITNVTPEGLWSQALSDLLVKFEHEPVY